MSIHNRYIRNVLIGFDQLINAVCGGDPDETISSRIGKRRNGPERFWASIVDRIFGKGHCKSSIETDEGRDQL